MFNTNKMKKGFTLIEIMTATSIFLVIMTISMGSIIGVFDANRKSQALKTVMNNMNLSLESMSREMRFGKNYHCETDPNTNRPLTNPQNCIGDEGAGKLVSFLSSDGDQIVYRQYGNTIEKSIDGGNSYVAITAPEMVIDDLSFYVFGVNPTPDNVLQPKVQIVIKGYAGAKESAKTNFTIQTMVSQRQLDL